MVPAPIERLGIPDLILNQGGAGDPEAFDCRINALGAAMAVEPVGAVGLLDGGPLGHVSEHGVDILPVAPAEAGHAPFDAGEGLAGAAGFALVDAFDPVEAPWGRRQHGVERRQGGGVAAFDRQVVGGAGREQMHPGIEGESEGFGEQGEGGGLGVFEPAGGGVISRLKGAVDAARFFPLDAQLLLDVGQAHGARPAPGNQGKAKGVAARVIVFALCGALGLLSGVTQIGTEYIVVEMVFEPAVDHIALPLHGAEVRAAVSGDGAALLHMPAQFEVALDVEGGGLAAVLEHCVAVSLIWAVLGDFDKADAVAAEQGEDVGFDQVFGV